MVRIAAILPYYFLPDKIHTASFFMQGAAFTQNIRNCGERSVEAAEVLAFPLRVRAGTTDRRTASQDGVRQELRAAGELEIQNEKTVL